MPIERRESRRKKMHESMTRYLETLRRERGIDALALSSENGFIAGSGDVDLEWMGLLGSSRRLRELKWEGRTLHVHPLEINAETLYLVATGTAVTDEGAIEGIRRILQ